MFIVWCYFYRFTGYQERSWELRRGHRGEQEEIIGWRLEGRGDALERRGVEGREEIKHLGEDGVKDQHLEGKE